MGAGGGGVGEEGGVEHLSLVGGVGEGVDIILIKGGLSCLYLCNTGGVFPCQSHFCG